MKPIATALIEQDWFKLSKTRALKICILITLLVMGAELIVGHLSKSLMLFSDGLHMLSHAASLAITLSAMIWAKQSGNKRIELAAALINGIGLLGFTAYIIYEAVLRMILPETLMVEDIYGVALLGLLVNLITALILASSGVEDLNTKSAFLHMLADTFSSIAILVGALVIQLFNWFWLDAVLSMVIAAVVGKWALVLIRGAYAQLLIKPVETTHKS
jgi:cobalt-zinc-cadmium efflux system protein